MVAAGEGLATLLEICPEGRWDLLPEGADLALAAVRHTAENCRSAVPGPKPGEVANDPQGASDRQKTLAALACAGATLPAAASLQALTAAEHPGPRPPDELASLFPDVIAGWDPQSV